MFGANNTYATMASCNPQANYVNIRSPSDAAWFTYDTVSASLSTISLAFIALLTLSDKRAQTHPNKMIAYVCLCEAYTFCQFVTRYVVCGYGYSRYLNWFYAITVQYPYVYLSCQTQGGSEASLCWEHAKNTLHTYN